MASGVGESRGMIGRDTERSATADFVDAIPSGLATLSIQGEAGIGKSTVWREGLAQAGGRGFQVLEARPAASEARLSFAGLSDLLEPVVDDVLAALSPPQRHALEVALLRAEIERSPHDERAVSVAFLHALRLLSERFPVLIAVDDAHWLDRPTGRVINFAVRRLAAAPVGVLASVRLGTDERSALDVDRSVEAGRGRTLLLGPLSVASLHQLLKERAGLGFQRRVLVKVHELSGGNPFYAIELGRALAARDQPLVPGEPLPVPGALTELVEDRLARLPAKTREALLVVSAVAQPTVEAIEAFDPAWNVRELLAHAERRGVVDINHGRVRFSHPLMSSAIYDRATLFDRQRAHRRLAQVVTDLEQRAHHLALAANGPDEKVAEALEQASAIADARGAPDAAAELLELAREATPPGRAHLARQRSLNAARHHVVAGDWGRAKVLADEVLSTSEPGPERAQSLHLLGKISCYGHSFQQAAELLQSALEASDPEPATKASIELDLVYALQTFAGFPAVVDLAHAALEHAEKSQDRGLQAEARAVAVMADFLSGRGLDRRELDRALADEDRNRRVPVNLRPSLIAGLIMAWIGESATAVAMVADLCKWLIDHGEEGELAMLAYYVVAADCWHGALETAARHAREMFDVATQLDTPTPRAVALCGLATANAYLGNVEEARQQAHDSLELFQQVDWVVATAFPITALGFLALSVDDPRGADRLLRPTVSMLDEAGLGEPSCAPFFFDEVEALIGIGELGLAESLLGRIEQRAHSLDRAVSLAPAARCRGLLHADRKEFTEAIGALQQALEYHARVHRPIENARTLLVLGQVQRRANQRRAASETLERALAIFEELGSAQWATRARDELARLGLRRRAGSELTPTEAQVAERAASGMTNREIAGALFISPKTVEANLARVYRKLGIGSRAELGVRIAERRQATGNTE